MTSRVPKHLLRKAVHCFFFSFLTLFLQPLEVYAQPGIFSAAGSMTAARGLPTATLLPNGQVLLTGGEGSSGEALASAELYDPATGIFSATGSMATARFDFHTATLLSNGQVLVVGGDDNSYNASAVAELYDPTSGTFSTTGSMTTGRYQHTATLLPNGQVLVAGGCYSTGGNPCQLLSSAEVYDPTTGIFTATGSLIAGRTVHTATLLPSGKVLVAGGADFNTYLSLSSAELYDPTTGIFTSTGSMSTARAMHTAALLPTGKVLVATGYNYSSYSILVSAELYDPATAAFSSTGSMTTGRIYQSDSLLANGELLIADGAGNAGLLTSAELYNAATGIFSATGSLITARDSSRLTLLPNGKVLATGGTNSSGALASAELYTVTPPLTVSPTQLSFSKIAVGDTSAAKKVTISNKTGLAVTLTSWVPTGADAADFNVVASTCAGVLKVKASCTVSITFAPQQAGVRSAALTVTDSASNGPQSVSLTGSGIVPVSASPSNLKFPGTKVGTTSSAKIVTITNNMAETLSISSIAPTGTNAGDFAVQTTTCGATLEAGAKCSVIVTFTPTATGSRVAALSISDGAVTSPQTVALSGTGK